jgi:hypothetical protein
MVRNALRKDGWTITHDPYVIVTPATAKPAKPAA